jgi:ribosomal protein L11 methyltransferase
MGNYIAITFSAIQPEQQELVIANLAEAGYEGFEEKETELKAFVPEAAFEPSLLKELAFKYQLTYTVQTIAAQNWNAVWESNFQPVLVDDFVAVRAHFHEAAKGVEHEIVITPKMSFGTGHHATTFMMMQQMRNIDFRNKTVFDFGTGTGVLAILAGKLGAKKILAIDNDDWSIENAAENFSRNNCETIDLKKADTAAAGEPFDIILANINKNVILENMAVLAGQVIPGGALLFSGLLKEDEKDIVASAEKQMLVFAGRTEKDNWLCLRFIR